MEDALEVFETELEYDGYFCSIKDVSYYRDFGKWSDIIKVQCQNCRKREEERQ